MRLIDADALIERYKNEKLYDYLVCEMIDEAPTIDAVPVVRCKDCKHIEDIEGYYPYCSYHNSECAYNNFCSYGERKDGDG